MTPNRGRMIAKPAAGQKARGGDPTPSELTAAPHHRDDDNNKRTTYATTRVSE